MKNRHNNAPRRTPISLDLASAVAALSGQSNGKGPCLSKTNGANENNETHKGGDEADTKKLAFEEVLLGRNYPEIFYHIHRLYFNHANVKWNNCGGYLAQNKSTKENPPLLNDFFIDYRNIVGKFSRKFRNINPLYFVDPYGLSIVWLSFIRSTLGNLQESMEVITTYLTERHYVNYVNTKSEKNNKERKKPEVSKNKIDMEVDPRLWNRYTNFKYTAAFESLYEAFDSGVYLAKHFFAAIEKLYTFYFYSQVGIKFEGGNRRDVYDKELQRAFTNYRFYELDGNDKVESIDLNSVTTVPSYSFKAEYDNYAGDEKGKLQVVKNAYSYVQENIKMSYAFQFEILNLAHRYDDSLETSKLPYFPARMMASNIGLPEVFVPQTSTPRPEVLRAAVSIGTTVTIANFANFFEHGGAGLRRTTSQNPRSSQL